jgi:hypothetical protein
MAGLITGVRRVLLRRAAAVATSTSDLMLDLILPLFDTNADPVDAQVTSGSYIILVYFGSQNANAWKSATNATYTVPVGKKLIVCCRIPVTNCGDSARNARLYNSTDAAAIDTIGADGVGTSIPWGGDAGNASKLSEVAAGKVIVVQLWNTDTTKRAMGVAYVCRLVDA